MRVTGNGLLYAALSYFTLQEAVSETRTCDFLGYTTVIFPLRQTSFWDINLNKIYREKSTFIDRLCQRNTSG